MSILSMLRNLERCRRLLNVLNVLTVPRGEHLANALRERRVNVNAIPTTYRGQRFRSRLEARWAAMFDELNWRWEYEPFDADGYIPDFIILGENPLLVEVKPFTSLGEMRAFEMPYAERVRKSWCGDLLLLGISPSWDTDHYYGVHGGTVAAGRLGDALNDPEYDPGYSHAWADAVWADCLFCKAGRPPVDRGLKQYRVSSDEHSFRCRPCSHYDGDSHLSRCDDDAEIVEMWHIACSSVQWKGRAHDE